MSIAKNTKRRKRACPAGRHSWARSAALDAARAALACIGLAGFAFVVWQTPGSLRPWIVLDRRFGLSAMCWKIMKVP